MAERPSVSEILARVKNASSEPSTSAQTPAPGPSESTPESTPPSANRASSTAEKIAAIRARSSGGPGPGPSSKPAPEADRPLSTADKVAAIRARAAAKKSGSESPGPTHPSSPPSIPKADDQARSAPGNPQTTVSTQTAPAPPSRGSGWLGWLSAGVLLILVLAFWGTYSAAPRAPETVRFAPPIDLPTGSVDDSRTADAAVFLVHVPLPDGSDGFYALSARCTFLDCILAWNASESRFDCPCHGCSYDLQGQPTKGPAPTPLPRLVLSRSADGGVQIERHQEVESPLPRPPGAIRTD